VNAGARVHYHAGGFVDGYDVRIFVENREGNFFRGGVERSRRGRLDVDGIALSSQMRRPARLAVDADMAVLDPILQAGAAVLGKTLVEHAILSGAPAMAHHIVADRREWHFSCNLFPVTRLS
jgi:hypothetical protein